MEKKQNIYESLKIGILLAISGGFMDAYSYICRDKVFANAQTGNIILLGINLSEGNFGIALQYLLPIVSFISGIVITNYIKNINKNKTFHWRQITLLIKAVILFIVAFLPQSVNLLANSLTSLVCAIQIETFRTIHGNSIATTMCIGNLRYATENICEYVNKKDYSNFKNGLIYYSIILFFIIGAILGKEAVNLINEKAIIFCSLIHIIIFAIVFKTK